VRYLIDTSAWHRTSNPAVLQRWANLLATDSVSICDQVALEVLFSARSAGDYQRTADNLLGLHVAEMTATTFRRARDVQLQLALSGGLHHRSVTIADLLIAAAAEEAGDTAAITHQPTEWLAARGTLS
jgi:predicted nucleic acid-binding protein